jgi:hypothetical protein
MYLEVSLVMSLMVCAPSKLAACRLSRKKATSSWTAQ